jgi:quinoprotein dehydrogenase-associated probable ABC transporter substrate-binding protein
MTCVRPRNGRAQRAAAIIALAGAVLAGDWTLHAQPEEALPGAFRVCQDPNNLPFSNTGKEGFENRIAELFAQRLQRPIEYFSFPQRMGFIRNTLQFKLPGEPYRCDVVMGVPAQYGPTATTRPYYRSTYALVVSAALTELNDPLDLVALPPARRTGLRIGVYDRSPGAQWLARHGMLDQAVPYPMLNADPQSYPGQIIERDLAAGRIDAAIVWGPIAGFFAKRLPESGLRILPLASEPGLPLEFDIAIGVRHADREWRDVLDRLIVENAQQIEAILREYNVPLVQAGSEARR